MKVINKRYFPIFIDNIAHYMGKTAFRIIFKFSTTVKVIGEYLVTWRKLFLEWKNDFDRIVRFLDFIKSFRQ